MNMMRDVYTEKRALEYISVYGPPDNPKPEYLARMKYIASFIPVGSVLDVACGAGYLLPQLKNGSSYNGVDSSPYMIKMAEKYTRGGVFTLGDAFDISNFGAFNTVVANSLFIHIEPDLHIKLLTNLWNHALDQVIFTIPIDKDIITLVETESQKEKTLITNISYITFNKLISSLNPKPQSVKQMPFPAGTFGYGLNDYLIRLMR